MKAALPLDQIKDSSIFPPQNQLRIYCSGQNNSLAYSLLLLSTNGNRYKKPAAEIHKV
jgi:hypothetical protein